MKVLTFVHTYGERNGISLHVYNICRSMPQGVEMEIVGGKGWQVPFFSALRIPSPGEAWAALTSEYEVMHVHGYGNFFSFFGAKIAFLRGKKLVWTIHGYPRIRGARKLFYHVYRYLMAPLIFWKAGKIISVSSDILPILRKETGKEIAVLPNGIDLGLFSPRSSYSSAKEVCYVGRLDEDKGIFRMLKCSRFPLLFIGPDEDGNRKKLKQEAARLGRTASFIETDYKGMPAAYSRCRYVVLPSKYEGFPLTLLESIAMGRPFVSTDVGQVKEVLEELGLSPDEFLLRGGIDEKLSSLEKKGLEKELAAARKKLAGYSWEKVAQKTAALYKSALEG